MKKMCLAHLGLLLLALHLLSSQVVQAQNTTDAPMDTTMSNYTVTPTVLVNATSTDKSGSGRTEASTLLLLPLALAAFLLHGCSQ